MDQASNTEEAKIGYAALTAFLEGGHAPVTTLDLARRLVHYDFKASHVYLRCTEDEDRASDLIAKLIDQEVERALRKASDQNCC